MGGGRNIYVTNGSMSNMLIRWQSSLDKTSWATTLVFCPIKCTEDCSRRTTHPCRQNNVLTRKKCIMESFGPNLFFWWSPQILLLCTFCTRPLYIPYLCFLNLFWLFYLGIPVEHLVRKHFQNDKAQIWKSEMLLLRIQTSWCVSKIAETHQWLLWDL